MKELAVFIIQQAMQLYDGNLSKVAKGLQINRTTLYRRMQKMMLLRGGSWVMSLEYLGLKRPALKTHTVKAHWTANLFSD